MCPVDRFGSGTVAFRTGAQSNQTLEIIQQDLNNARGSAYNVEDGTAIYYENYALSKALTDFFENNAKLKNQFSPDTMGDASLSRWEAIFGIITPPNSTVTYRQNIISLFFQRWSRPPTLANLTYFAEQLLGKCFIEFQLYDSMDTGVSFIPGGATIPGGAHLFSSTWKSYVSFINTVIWQPVDKYGNKQMDDATFAAISKNFYRFFSSYLPAYVSFNYFQYNTDGYGSVSGFLNDTNLYGTGTNFTSIFRNRIFVVDDNNNPNILTVKTILSDTQLILANPLTTSITGSQFWAYQSNCLVLDVPNNLDSLKFCE